MMLWESENEDEKHNTFLMLGGERIYDSSNDKNRPKKGEEGEDGKCMALERGFMELTINPNRPHI